MKSKFGIKGILSLDIFENGELIESSEQDNVITYLGLQRLFSSQFPVSLSDSVRPSSRVTKIGFGTSSLNAGDLNVHTLTGILLKNLSSVTVGSSDGIDTETICTFSLDSSEGNGMTIQELGLWSSYGVIDNTTEVWEAVPSGDVAFNRIVRAPIVKTSAISIQGVWRIICDRS